MERNAAEAFGLLPVQPLNKTLPVFCMAAPSSFLHPKWDFCLIFGSISLSSLGSNMSREPACGGVSEVACFCLEQNNVFFYKDFFLLSDGFEIKFVP